VLFRSQVQTDVKHSRSADPGSDAAALAAWLATDIEGRNVAIDATYVSSFTSNAHALTY